MQLLLQQFIIIYTCNAYDVCITSKILQVLPIIIKLITIYYGVTI